MQLPIKQRKAVVGWVSRPRSKYNSRAVINEAEVVAALAKHYGAAAEVRTLHFNRSLTQAMQDVADLDIMVGVHGAGGPPVLALNTGRCWVHVGVVEPEALGAQAPTQAPVWVWAAVSHCHCVLAADQGLHRGQCCLHTGDWLCHASKQATCSCAGLTNVLWMRPGASVVQLTPYGWCALPCCGLSQP